MGVVLGGGGEEMISLSLIELVWRRLMCRFYYCTGSRVNGLQRGSDDLEEIMMVSRNDQGS